MASLALIEVIALIESTGNHPLLAPFLPLLPLLLLL